MLNKINKINNVGLQLLEYKEELLKDYPKIVRDALILSLEQMAEQKIIDIDTFETIKNTDESVDLFLAYLLTKKEFTKSYKELFKEYEEIREELNKDLELQNLFDLKTETIVEKDVICILKTFSINESFVMEFFGVEEKDLIKLMKRRGFVEKFAALRLTKVLTDIIKEGKINTTMIKLDNSLAYFNENGDGYNIDLIMEASVNDLIAIDKKKRIISEVKTIRKLADKTYKEKMIC